MKRIIAILIVLFACAPSVRAEDVRLQPLKDLNGYFPFNPPGSLADWNVRREYVRRQILVAAGLWPMPAKTPLNAVIHGRIDCGRYTVEKVFFESAPGFFVTGNLYRPSGSKGPSRDDHGQPERPECIAPENGSATGSKGRVPGVMLAHGHWKNARFHMVAEDKLRKDIADGAERFERGGLSIQQSLCRQLALMGCVVWQWDMLSDSDSIQFSREIIHGFAKQRPEMNTTRDWGLYSPQAESHCQSVMGLQTLNAVRGLDFLLSLPEVDPERVAITGASGGGTQTMLLSAVDDRVQLSFPVVMVSTAMQGGCTCENASLLRVNTGNVEFAALFAPKPLGMNTAGDWTKEMATKGFPELQNLYALYGKKQNVFLLRGEHFPHNYNAVTRSAFYTFLNKHFKLGLPSPVIETDYDPLPPEQLSVWDDKHPAPKAADPDFERKLLKWWTDDANEQLRAAAATPEGMQKTIRPAVEVLLGRTFEGAGMVEWKPGEEQDRGDYLETAGTVLNRTYGEEVNAVVLRPKHHDGRAVVWLDDNGKSSLRNVDGSLKPAVLKLVERGATVIGADLLYQGDKPMKETRVVANTREFAGYTFGYNHALFAQRTHDVLTIVSMLRNDKAGPMLKSRSVAVAGWRSAGPIVAAARALAGKAIDRAAVDTGGFRFGKLLDYRDPMFLPGGAKYLDLPGILALGAPGPLWLAGEGKEPEIVADAYRAAKAEGLRSFTGKAAQKEASAGDWLLGD